MTAFSLASLVLALVGQVPLGVVQAACHPFEAGCCHINPLIDPSYNAYKNDPLKHVPGWDIVDLDAPPSKRWTNVVQPVAQPLQQLAQHFKRMLGQASQWLLDLLEDSRRFQQVTRDVLDYLGEYGEEMRGVASASGLSEEDVLIFNMMYEIEGGCTSIVAQDPSGRLVHGRNVDFGLFFGEDWQHLQWSLTEALRPTIRNVRFIQGGKEVFNSTVFAGYVGLLTGAKYQGFSLSVNSRIRLGDRWQHLRDFLLGRDRSGHFLSLLLREVMIRNQTYSEALEVIEGARLLGPTYIILGGSKPGEGVIVARNYDSVYKRWLLSDAAAGGRNSIVQANWDRPDDPWFDNRRAPAEHCLTEDFNDHIDFRALFEVLSSHPVRNRLTTYTALMSTQSGAYEAYFQFCDEPECAPWMTLREHGVHTEALFV